MLVLSRKPMEAVRIFWPDGRFADVTMVEVRGEGARIGFEFPGDVRIVRHELLAREAAQEVVDERRKEATCAAG